MAFKIILLAAFVVAVSAVAVPIQTYHGAPALIKTVAPVIKTVEYDAPAHYDFSYSVHDPHTGDIKSQSESRKGDAVHGSYSLIDSDGYQRIVEYTADAHNGFNAVVHRQPTQVKIPVAAKVISPIAKVFAPVAHAAPIVHAAPVVHAAPAYYAAPKIAAYAPIAKVAAPLAVGYGAAHVAFSGPAVSYHY